MVKELKRKIAGGVINTQVGKAKIIERKYEKSRSLFKISCPLGRGTCIFSDSDIISEGRWLCPFCRKENPILQEVGAIDKVKREALGRPKRKDIHKGAAWSIIRYEVLKRDGGRCVLCGRSAKDGVKLHIDHIKPANLYPELYYDMNNLQTLCSDCNIGKGDTDDIDWR